jgi:hypothetical protein
MRCVPISRHNSSRKGPRRSLHYGHALVGEDRVEGTGELGVAVPDEEAELRDPVAEVHQQVAGLLGSPCAVRCPPGSVHVPRGRRPPPGAQDPPHCRFADLVAEPTQLTVHPAVSPGRILPRQPHYQVADVLAGPRAAGPVRVRPLAGDQPTVPCGRVPGLTSRLARSTAGSSRANAARIPDRPSPASGGRPAAAAQRLHDGAS